MSQTEPMTSEQQSGSGANNEPGSSSEKLGTNKDNVAAFIDSWKNFDRAGSYLMSSLCKDLSGSQPEGVLGSTLSISLFSGSGSEQVLGQLKEMGNMLSQCTKQDHQGKLNLSQVLLLFLKLQLDYHYQCTQSLTSLVEQLVHSCDKKENSELFHHIRNLELHKYVSSRHSPSRSFGFKKSSAAGSNSPKAQKHSIKSSLFSLFERKNSPDESHSSFYVDLNQEPQSEKINQSQPVSDTQKLDNNQSEALIQLGLDPVVSSQESANILRVDNSPLTSHGTSVPVHGATLLDVLEVPMVPVYQSLSPSLASQGLSPGSASQGCKPSLNSGATGFTPSSIGQVASQEELDSVINLLSGVGTGSGSTNHMSPISEQHSPLQGQVSLQVPLMYGPPRSPSASDSGVDVAKTHRNPAQRRSEGSIDLSGFGNPGRNTWPHQHRSSLPGGHLALPVQYDYMTSTHSPRYLPETQPAMTLPPGGANHLPPGYQWGFPDPQLNRTWPVNNLAGSSMWSAGQDSDDASDDDSSTDQFFNFTQQLHQNKTLDDSAAMSKKMTQDAGVRHHSFEDLLDGPASEAWQASRQPWSHPVKNSEPVQSHDSVARNSGYHRPITMQWSDPLSSRNLWPAAGLEGQGQIQSQSVHGFGGQ